MPQIVKAKWEDELGTQVRVDYDNGSWMSFPTTENGHMPWIELRGMVARGEITIEPFTPPKPLTKAQRKKLGISNE